MRDIVERLLKVAAVSEIIKDNPKIYYDAAHEIEVLRAENEKLREALRPFADKYLDDTGIAYSSEEYRNAAATIRESGDD